MAEINPTDHKSISDHLFPDESEAVSELDETERDNKQVEAEFSILRNNGLSKFQFSPWNGQCEAFYDPV